MSEQVKVRFHLDEPSRERCTETMWATKVGDCLFQLQNSPFAAIGVSYLDIVRATGTGEIVDFESVHARGGHSSYRLYLQGGLTIDSEEFCERWQAVAALDATFENANGKIVLVDIPPGADAKEIYELFEAGEAERVWAFEEAHYEPPPQSTVKTLSTL